MPNKGAELNRLLECLDEVNPTDSTRYEMAALCDFAAVEIRRLKMALGQETETHHRLLLALKRHKHRDHVLRGEMLEVNRQLRINFRQRNERAYRKGVLDGMTPNLIQDETVQALTARERRLNPLPMVAPPHKVLDRIGPESRHHCTAFGHPDCLEYEHN
jgi:hypothetical protein